MNRWRKILSFVGPGYIIAVGYIDPGNWATNVAAGAVSGFNLLSIVLLSAVIGALLQGLVVRLATNSGLDLAQLIRQTFPRKYWFLVWDGGGNCHDFHGFGGIIGGGDCPEFAVPARLRHRNLGGGGGVAYHAGGGARAKKNGQRKLSPFWWRW